ncbi:E3 ubiquitin-protein ligase RNF38 [Octopus bimaculoides]|uniref:E3 ubiquitin-protein ligase RNF38 n=1 Tax=Octopus bimaculoides TaxID=37653 RepID=UPI0022DF3448|nr:E3 ubiquitin-protein ligase RNF38 [Octopus bimaculoides]XP_052825958.1 E3 ubiquitin-protein ligase RNF38 [Octopus bimaculoides]
MPVATSQKEAQLARTYSLLSSKPSASYSGRISPSLVSAASESLYTPESGALLSEMGQITNMPTNSNNDNTGHFFSTHSPPILNLSPNLSPVEHQRTSPGYDLRETARRRSIQDSHHGSFSGPGIQHPSSFYSSVITEDSGRKSESPSRKRRKTSNTVDIELRNSPSPPPSRPWEVNNETVRLVRRWSTSHQRRNSAENCITPKPRLSPITRRRIRERNTTQRSESPDRRAFQPTAATNCQMHPALLGHQNPQQPIMFDLEQVPVSAPVTIAPYAIPVCTGTHPSSVCTTAHLPVCASQPTWSIPPCSVPIPSCSMQHIPACSLQQLPPGVAASHHAAPPHAPPHHAIPAPPPGTLLHQNSMAAAAAAAAAAHAARHMSSQHHINTAPGPPHHPGPHHHPSQFAPNPQPPPQPDDDVQIITEHRPTYSLTTPVHHVSPLNPSPPIMLQEPSTLHPATQDIYDQFSRLYPRRALSRNRMRAFAPAPPPTAYPGFLLHFLAMLGNPPMPATYNVELNEDAAAEVENYEALLNLAERLGEAKPRGLTKANIDQLIAYRFNAETRRANFDQTPCMDQTSCVICMCDFENRQLLRVLPCSHEFHAKCVDKWLKTNRTCPICRADASEVVNQGD